MILLEKRRKQPSVSRLNMIEIEFSAFVKQCLDWRISSLEQLRKEIMAIAKERNNKHIKIQLEVLN
jgi:hypothetical protein